MSKKYYKHLVCLFLAVLGMSQSAAADFKDFSVIVNNQTGTLLTAEEQVQGTAVEFGVAVSDDGTVSRVAASDASSVATISGKYHSDHGCTGLKAVVPVSGAVTILVGQCTYSGNDIIVTNSAGETVATATPGKACWKNDRTNVTELIYKGEATTLTITGMSYCPFIAVKKYVEPATFRNFSAIVNNQGGTLLTAEEQVQGTAVSFGVAVSEDGVVSRVAADDVANAVAVISGKYHSEHGCTGLKVTVKVPGNVKITVGQCTYSKSAITVTNSAGETVATLTPSNPACWKNSTDNVDVIYYNGDATTLTITGMSYCPYIAVEEVSNKLKDAATTATFPFDLGTEDQIADFGNMGIYILSSKVTHGANLFIKDKGTHAGVTETRFQPTVNNEKAASEDNAIKFLFRPYPGLEFTPKKVSLKATRFGTDGGKLDFSWINPDGTTVSLATEQTANRNNSDAPSNFEFEISGATVAEGECGLLVNLYSLGETKQVGFANIVIEGTLNGEKQEIPILASFSANGVSYNVDDIFEIVGDDYVANIELFKSDKMISSENPITDVVAKAGTVGTITYEGDDQKTVVTIPVTHNNMTMKWVANFVRKPFYTLTYIDTDGKTEIGTQKVEKDVEIQEFAFDGTKATVAEGYVFRGWATANSGSTAVKYNTKSTFTENTNLYAFTTVKEVATPTARFDYDLTQQNFDPADHEMLTFEGTGYWHDNQHGWAFQKGDKIKLEMGGKGYIKLSLCKYSADGDLKLYAPDGTTVIGTTANKVETDGASTTIEYDGAQGAGILTLEIPAVSYIHSISIRNQAEDPYTKAEGEIYIVKRGATDIESGKNLLSMLELANGFSGTERKVIFLPDGTYDLEETVLTTISRNNISLIGQSMDGTIIKNAPDISIEGIGTTATLVNTSTGLYMQDLTLQNALDYYGAVKAGMGGGRAVCLQDKGKQTICKNVKMLSYQDTYYSNSNSQFYWEDSEIHGTVDYLCGSGDVYYNGCTFVNESRSAEGKTGSDVITAPYTDASCKFGYVFNNCTIENLSATFSLGRSWGGNSTSVWLNTIMNQPKEIIDTRFTLAGMNVAAYKFKEYKSVDTEGNVVSPASLIETFSKGSQSFTYDIILKDEEAAEFTLDKVFPNWTPNEIAKQAAAPTNVKIDGTTLTWDANDAKLWAIVKDGQVVSFTTSNAYTIDDASASYSVRAANTMGGLSEAAECQSIITITFANTGYATFYDSKKNYQIPSTLKAFTVTAATSDALTYTEVKDIIPAGTAVMLQSENKTGGDIEMMSTSKKAEYTGQNMLMGSDEATTTTADVESLFYKLSFGNSTSDKAGSFGWFWGADNGAAFQIEGHRAWLAVPQQKAASTRAYLLDANGQGTTAIKTIESNDANNGVYYNMQGMPVASPKKGIYIYNNKKVIVK